MTENENRGAARSLGTAELAVCYRFENGSVEPERNLVRIDGQTVTLEPRAMEVLAFLVARAGLVVSKEELLEGVWQGKWVHDDALSVYIYELRKALGDDARRPRFVETVRKRGYRWIPPVRIESRPPEVVADTPAALLPPAPPRNHSGRVGIAGSLFLVVVLGAGALITRPPPRSGEATHAPGGTAPGPESSGIGSDRSASLALEEVRRGDLHFRGRTPRDLNRAEACYLRATRLDPELAEAWGGLALTYAVMAEFPLRDRFELYHEARSAAEAGLALDPDTTTAHVAKALVELVMDWDRAEAHRQIERALETDPYDARAWEIRGWIQSADGRYDAALESLDRAIELDPTAASLHSVASFVHALAGDLAATQAKLEHAAGLDPESYLIRWYGWYIFRMVGDEKRAVEWLLEAFQLAGRAERVAELREVYETGGMDALNLLYRDLLPKNANYIELARIALYFGERDQALDYLEQSAANRDSELTWLGSYPELSSLHGEPRFQEILRRTGSPAALPD